MSHTDPIADMLTIIRNAQAAGKSTVKIPYSNIKFDLAKILEKNGYIEGAEKKGTKPKQVIIATLKYKDNGTPRITSIKRVSKPGQRIYVGYKDVRQVKEGFGTTIISTPAGLLTSEEAKKQKLGGECICQVW